jgi:uncharacterized protein
MGSTGRSSKLGRRCPICRKSAEPRPENSAFPFCSERCRLIDLGRWLGEEYRVASDSDSDGEPPPPSDED